MLCYRCGSHVPDGSEACSACGQRFDAAARGGKTGVFQRRKPGEFETAGVKVGELLAGRYEIRSIIGQGPLGAVFRTLDREVDVEIGLKLIASRLLQSTEERADFLRLLKQAKRLSHPNVVRIYEIGSLEGVGGTPATEVAPAGAASGQRQFFTMQLLDGLTLRRVIELRVEKGQPFSLREVEPIIAQIALALDHASAYGPHGDLKPENVIVLPDLLKVTDFGVGPAIPRAPFVAAQRIRKADVYLAPELLAGRSIDGRSDVYSLGVILGEMLGGALPTGGEAPDLRAANPDLPGAIEALYRRCLSSNPETRFQRAGDLAAELLALAEGTAPPLPKSSAPARPTRPPPPPPDSLPGLDRRRPKPPSAESEAQRPPERPALELISDEEIEEEDEARTELLPAPSKAPSPPAARPPPPPADAAKEGAPAARPPRDPGAIPIERSVVPPPSSPQFPARAQAPLATRRSARWVPLGILGLLALAYGGYVAVTNWKIQEEHRIKAQLRAEFERKLATSQQLDAGTSPSDAGMAGVAAVVPSDGGSAPRTATGAPTLPLSPDAGSRAAVRVATAVEATTPRTAAGPAARPRHRAEKVASADPTPPVARGGEACLPGMRLIHAGAFALGTPEGDDLGNFGDRPERRVPLHAYCIDLYEFPDRPDAKPAAGLAFAAAQSSCEAEGKRLCSEEEWEKACKGPENHRFPYGNGFESTACNGGGKGVIRPTGSFPKCRSGFGIFDLSGNVAEWTSTHFQSGTSDRTVKGGSADRPDYDLRCSARQNRSPSSRSANVGFRCCSDSR